MLKIAVSGGFGNYCCIEEIEIDLKGRIRKVKGIVEGEGASGRSPSWHNFDRNIYLIGSARPEDGVVNKYDPQSFSPDFRKGSNLVTMSREGLSVSCLEVC